MLHKVSQTMLVGIFIPGAGMYNQAKMGHIRLIGPVYKPDSIRKLAGM
jgi:hypothetical protein